MKILRLNCKIVRLNMLREADRINAALDELKVADDLRDFEYISLA